MKTYVLQYRQWNSKIGKEEIKTVEFLADDLEAAQKEAIATFDHLVVSVKIK